VAYFLGHSVYHLLPDSNDGQWNAIERFDRDNRRLALNRPCHFMGNQCVSLSYFFMCTFLWCMPASVNMLVVPPPGENPGDATVLL